MTSYNLITNYSILARRPAHPRCRRSLRFFEEVPRPLTQFGTTSVSKYVLGRYEKTIRLLAQFLADVLLPLVIRVLAARFEVEVNETPVLEVIAERLNAHLQGQTDELVQCQINLSTNIEMSHFRF